MDLIVQLLLFASIWLAGAASFALAAQRRRWLDSWRILPFVVVLGPFAWLIPAMRGLIDLLELRAEIRGREGPNTDEGRSDLGGG